MITLVALRVLCWTIGTSRCMVFGAISTLIVGGKFSSSVVVVFVRGAAKSLHLSSISSSLIALMQHLCTSNLIALAGPLIALMKHLCTSNLITLAGPSPMCGLRCHLMDPGHKLMGCLFMLLVNGFKVIYSYPWSDRYPESIQSFIGILTNWPLWLGGYPPIM